MATYATQDDLNALASLVRTLEDNVTTLDDSVGELDSLVDRVNHMETLKDVTITYITEGDVLQYSSDGTWHNVQPGLLNMNAGDTDGSPVDSAIVKALILSEGSKLFLSKVQDDIALRQITFQNGLVSNGMVYLKEGVQIGNYVPGLMGTGAKIDKDGRAELTSLTVREFLEVPESRFNKIDVVSGELWNSIAFGTIESVDEENQIFTVKLEEGEYNGLHVNDICRGIFHNINGDNETVEKEDDCGFQTVQGFGTSYFTPIEVYGEYNKYVKYALKSGCKYHPKPAMKFAVYGNFTDEYRRDSAYSTKTYKRFLKGVKNWEISLENIASQFGLLDGLNIPGAPNNGNLVGNGAYLSNVYMTDALIQFTPQQEEHLKGKDGYSVNLTRYETTVIVDNDFNVITDYQQSNQMEFGIQAFKGPVELTYNNVYGEGKYFVEYTTVGCNVTFGNGVFKITEIINPNSEMYIDIIVNCEGMVNIKQRFHVNYQLEGNSVWVTYYDGDELPPIPTGDGTSNGWHRDFTSTAIWMSSKSSRKVDEGVWGDPVRFVGASVAGKDGQYTAFVYANSSVQPNTPLQNSGIPPLDPTGTLTWYTYPPERLNNSIYTWMTQAIVYADKTMSGWTSPIRITGDDGQDGVDGLSLEFIYSITTEYKAPPQPQSPPDQDDPDLTGTGWTDSPVGVSKNAMYEWVSQRKKERDKEGVAKWGAYTAPVLWSKWGEKGMDGDGYEYIYTRTAEVTIVPSTPKSIQQDDFKPTIANGASQDYNWTDNPKGVVDETLKAEWVCMRNKTNGVWSNYSSPALWSNWGEQGMQGAHYIYRWTISTTTPQYEPSAVNPNKGTTEWVNDSEIQTTETGQFVWQIQCLSNPDGTQGEWGNLIRLTGANGKDGEDGNSIEFLYARNNTGIAPSTPPTNQITDWEGTVQDTNNNVSVTWHDNPQGVTQNIMYEYVCQRYFDKITQQWGAYSTPGIWARYSEKGKDGDGYEYIYRAFGQYYEQSYVSYGGQYYPTVQSDDYQNDEYVPTNFHDNPPSISETNRYVYVWTRKKKNGVWDKWSNGAIWSRYAEDGQKGDKGDTGASGISYSISPGAFSLSETNSGGIDPDSVTFKCYKSYVNDYGTLVTELAPVRWEVLGSNDPNVGPGVGTEISYSRNLESSFSVDFDSKGVFDYYWIGVHPTSFPDSVGDPIVASLTIKTLRVAQNNAQYIVTRFRGEYSDRKRYYYCNSDDAQNLLDATISLTKSNHTKYHNGEEFEQGDTMYAQVQNVNITGTGIDAHVEIYHSYNSELLATIPLTEEIFPITFTEYIYGFEIKLITNGYTSVSLDLHLFKTNNYKGNCIIRDYVYFNEQVYFVRNYSDRGIIGHPPTDHEYWELSSQMDVLTVNTLLAQNAKLGQFNFSNNIFTANDGTLTLDSADGSLTAKKGTIGGFTIGTSTLSAGDIYPMTITSSGTGDFASSGIVWKNSANDRLLSLGVSSSGGDIRVRNSSLYQVSITPASVFLSGESSIAISAYNSTPSFEILRSVQNPDYRIYMSVDSSGVADIRCRLKDTSGSTVYSGKIQIHNHDGYAMLILK